MKRVDNRVMTKTSSWTALAAAVFLACINAVALAQSNKVDVTGVWIFTVESPAGKSNPTLTFKQDGETLTGTYHSQMLGEQKITGTIKGNDISFGFTASFDGNAVKVTYSGTVEKTTMKGKVSFGDLGEGAFSAKKQ